MHRPHRPDDRFLKAGAAHAIGAWIFLAAALVAGAIGLYRMMFSTGADRLAVGGDCLCVGVFFGIIAAVLALLGIHRQNTVLYSIVGPGYQGSHGSDDDV